MKIVRLKAENYKRLQAVEITPDGAVVQIGGKNGQGKSSVLDAIYVALVGRSANPPKPVRAGEEKATIELDLGELTITRTFTEKDGRKYTDTLKVENSDGLRFGKPQEVLDALLGEIGFDPFDFVQQKPDRQAEILMEMVPLSVDLDEMAEQDQSDFLKRRDLNRDIKTLEGQLAGIPREDIPEDAPDRDKLVEQLGEAANTNTAIDRERQRRVGLADTRDAAFRERDRLRARAEELREQAAAADRQADENNTTGAELEKEIADLKPLDEFVDTNALREQIAEADQIEQARARQARRAEIDQQLKRMREQSDAFTKAIDEREKQREAALAEAQMPVRGLGFGRDDSGKPMVTFKGLPFTEDQISTAEALRVSTAIAMAANPTLRVLRIKDGSLLDEDSLRMLSEAVEANDYQLWIERVGDTGGVGFVLENGLVREEAK